MEELIPEIITAVVVPLIAAGVVAVRKWFLATVTPRQLSVVRDLARLVVAAVDEVARGEQVESKTKYHLAEVALIEAAGRVGVKLSKNEANTFIHAVLGGTRNELEVAAADIASGILEEALAGLSTHGES